MSLQRAISRNADLRQVYVSLDERLNNITCFMLMMMEVLEKCGVSDSRLEKLSIAITDEITRVENELNQTE